MVKDNKVDKAISKAMGQTVIIFGYSMSIGFLCMSVLCMIMFFQSKLLTFFWGIAFLVLGFYSFLKISKMKKKYLGD